MAGSLGNSYCSLTSLASVPPHETRDKKRTWERWEVVFQENTINKFSSKSYKTKEEEIDKDSHQGNKQTNKKNSGVRLSMTAQNEEDG